MEERCGESAANRSAERIRPGAGTRISSDEVSTRDEEEIVARPKKGHAKDMVCEHGQERDGPEAIESHDTPRERGLLVVGGEHGQKP